MPKNHKHIPKLFYKNKPIMPIKEGSHDDKVLFKFEKEGFLVSVCETCKCLYLYEEQKEESE